MSATGGYIRVADRPLPAMNAYDTPVAVLILDASGLNFLIHNLPETDGMTTDLLKLRERAKEELWGRHS